MRDWFAELDARWQQRQSADLVDMLDEISSEDDELAFELCAADLEWRWRTPSKSRSASDPIPDFPSCRDYFDLMNRFRKHSESSESFLSSFSTLAEVEWTVRSLWGDQPNIDDFIESRADVKLSAESLMSRLDEMSPMIVTLIAASASQAKCFQVGSQFVIGRQNRNDPPPPSWNASKSRVVVAPPHFRTISREQLAVRRTRLDEVEVQDLTSTTIRQGQSVLNPGKSKRLRLPVHLIVGDVEVHLRTDWKPAIT